MKLSVIRKIAGLMGDEKLNGIRSILGPFSVEERRQIVSMKIQKKSLLLAAVKQNEIALVKYLLDECGANINDAGPCLSIAASNKCLEVVELLLNKGLDINSVDHEQKSALFIACLYGDISLVAYLVENGANIDNADIVGNTPLMVSVKFPNICGYLLNKGADPNRANVHGNTALMLAVEDEMSHYSVHVLLAFQANINLTNEFGDNAVFLAAQNGFTHIVDYLEAYGADVTNSLAKSHQIDSCYASLQNLHIKAQHYWQMSQTVLDMSTTIADFKMNGESTTESSFEPIVNYLNSTSRNSLLLLEKRFGPHNIHTLRAIAVAVCNTEDLNNSVSIFSFLLETLESTKNSTYFEMIHSINATCTWMIWILKKHDKIHETLDMAQEIFRSYANYVGKFAIRFRRLSNKEKASKLMTIDSYFSIIVWLMQTVHHLNPEKLSVLNESVEKILSLDLRGSGYNSLLHFCVKNAFPVDLCKALLSCGADANCQNKERLTPVHYTFAWPHYQQRETINMFLTRDFDFKACNDGEFCLICTLNKRRLLSQPVKKTTLQCLAAAVVSQNEFRYQDEVPRHLQSVVYSHF